MRENGSAGKNLTVKLELEVDLKKRIIHSSVGMEGEKFVVRGVSGGGLQVISTDGEVYYLSAEKLGEAVLESLNK